MYTDELYYAECLWDKYGLSGKQAYYAAELIMHENYEEADAVREACERYDD